MRSSTYKAATSNENASQSRLCVDLIHGTNGWHNSSERSPCHPYIPINPPWCLPLPQVEVCIQACLTVSKTLVSEHRMGCAPEARSCMVCSLQECSPRSRECGVMCCASACLSEQGWIVGLVWDAGLAAHQRQTLQRIGVPELMSYA